MAARRLSEKQLSIPEDAHFLDFSRSDGDSSRWPKDTTEIVDEEGQVNFMKPVSPNDNTAVRWRLGVAHGLANGLNLPQGPTYALRNWPDGYAFYDHHKGKQEDPRHDLYLFGSKSRYRSVNEFIPHALWLLQDATMDPANCRCKYCQKTSQREVHASMAPGILHKSFASASPSRPKPTNSKVKLSREGHFKNRVEPKVFVAVQKKLPPSIPSLTKSGHVHPKHAMLVERNADLRAIHTKSRQSLKRWHRAGELVWCALTSPITNGPAKVAIQCWPGLIDEHVLKSKPIHEDTNDSYADSSLRRPMPSGSTDEDIVMDAPNGSVPWKNHHFTEYRIQLLGVNHAIFVADHHVLPYQAYIPPQELMVELRKYPPEPLNYDRRSLSSFNPCPKNEIPSFEAAVAPYAAAIEIGSALANFWCLTDEWSFEYSLPPSEVVSQLKPVASSDGPTSLMSALQNANYHNSRLQDPGTSSSAYYRNVSGPNAGMSTPEVQSLSARVVGRLASGVNTRVQFQGLWWGAERIWTDEFVRLKLPRRCIAPNGAEHILPPSGPGRATREICLSEGKDPAAFGAGMRGVFMRLEGLFVVDVHDDDGITIKKECRASGMIYELADVDWELDKDDGAGEINGAVSSLDPVTSGATSNPPSNPLTASQLSHPNFPDYFAPLPPEGFVFRPLLPEGHEVVVSLSLICGRYYPGLLSHPLLASALLPALDQPVLKTSYLWALEGLSAGYYNAVDPVQYKTSRGKMVEDADRRAIQCLEEDKQRRIAERSETKAEEGELDLELMDVDA